MVLPFGACTIVLICLARSFFVDPWDDVILPPLCQKKAARGGVAGGSFIAEKVHPLRRFHEATGHACGVAGVAVARSVPQLTAFILSDEEQDEKVKLGRRG